MIDVLGKKCIIFDHKDIITKTKNAQYNGQ